MALAGPAASFLLALVTAPLCPTLAGVSLALGGFNLLPLAPLDGGRVLGAAVSRWKGPDLGEWVCRQVTRVMALGLVGLGLWSFLRSGSFTLLLFALGFLLCEN